MEPQTTYVCRKPHSREGPKVGSGVQSCPLGKGAIWVHVADDAGKGVAAIPVSNPSGSGEKPTDGSGFSPFDPLDEGSGYAVTIGPLPENLKDSYFLPKIVTASGVPVKKGEITSVEFKLDRACKLKVIVREKDEQVYIKDVNITLTGPAAESATAPDGTTTGANGEVLFQRLRKAACQAKLALAETDKKKYSLEEPDTQDADPDPDRTNEVIFRVIPMTWIKLQIRDKEADAIPEEEKRKKAQPKAKFKIKQPDGTGAEKPSGDAGLAEFEMKKKKDAACALEEIAIDGEELYEFVSATES